MLLFDKTASCDICLLNQSPYVRLAAEDLIEDFFRVSESCIRPRIIDAPSAHCIIIEKNTLKDYEPAEHESFSVRVEGERIYISADGYLGTLWGIYTVSERFLGVDPCYLFSDLAIEKKERIEIADTVIEQVPDGFTLRGFFINDEDLLTGWKDGGGIRKLDFPWYGVTVTESAIRAVIETALRLRQNLIIPASFLDIENPPEKLLADLVAERGIYISQHHIEPLGVSAFTFKNYLEKTGRQGAFSYAKSPALMEEVWAHYAKQWAKYPNVVWQIGLRGEGDRPVWQESVPTESELAAAGEFISRAYEKQREIVMRATDGKARYFTSTLWMEGSLLTEKGYLRFPKDTTVVFADTGLTQMFGKEFYSLPRKKDGRYGIYYHLQYFDSGPHLAPQTGLDKLLYNMRLAYEKNDRAYFIMNVSNVREFVFELAAYAAIAWRTRAFSKNEYIRSHFAIFGEHREKMAALIAAYYKNLPFVSTAHIATHGHAKYFNFFLDEVSEDFHNHTLKEGDILGFGDYILYCFFKPLGEKEGACRAYFDAILSALPAYEALCEGFDELSKEAKDPLALHIRAKWLLYTKTLISIYKWYINVYKAREFCLKSEAESMKKALTAACKALEDHLDFRKCAEYGEFKNWYRGDLKMNIAQHLLDTYRRLGQTRNFS